MSFCQGGGILKTCQRCLTQRSKKCTENNRTPETASSDTLYHIQHTPLITSTEEHLIALTEAKFPQFLQSQFECLNDDMVVDKEHIEISCQVILEADGFLNPKDIATKFRIAVEREDGYKWK